MKKFLKRWCPIKQTHKEISPERKVSKHASLANLDVNINNSNDLVQSDIERNSFIRSPTNNTNFSKERTNNKYQPYVSSQYNDFEESIEIIPIIDKKDFEANIQTPLVTSSENPVCLSLKEDNNDMILTIQETRNNNDPRDSMQSIRDIPESHPESNYIYPTEDNFKNITNISSTANNKGENITFDTIFKNPINKQSD
jgi:hypothetical protein